MQFLFTLKPKYMKKLILVSAISIIFAATSIAQNVGIGTTSPTTKLHVAGAIASTPNTDVAAATVSIPNNTTIFRLSATAGVQANALSMSGTPTEGQLLTIYNQDGDPATFAGYTIPATSGVVTVEYINTGWRLVSSENGNPAWSTTGNTGTTASNFVGTTDNNGLTFKTNNAIIGFLPSSAASTGNTYFGVGNGTPGGIYNVAFGFHTQNSSNTGSGNVSIGWNVLDINTTGSSNVGIGWQSLAFNATGGGNTAVGTQSMMLNSGGGLILHLEKVLWRTTFRAITTWL